MAAAAAAALALLDDPPVLLLDEPTASLDDWSRELLTRRARELADAGKAVLVSTHARGELQAIADRALTLTCGRAQLLDLGAGGVWNDANEARAAAAATGASS